MAPLTPGRRALRVLMRDHELPPVTTQVSFFKAFDLPSIPPSTTVLPFPQHGFRTLPQSDGLPRLSPGKTSSVEGIPSRGQGFTIVYAGSPTGLAESGSLSYGLDIHLQLLPTPPRGDAVTIGYKFRNAKPDGDLHPTDQTFSERTQRRINAFRVDHAGNRPLWRTGQRTLPLYP